MMQAAEVLYRQGKLTESAEQLQGYLRDHPADGRARSFLFELLCFTGEFGRSLKQLAMLAESSEEMRLGSSFYMAALNAETARQRYYEASLSEPDSVPAVDASGSIAGKRDGIPFSRITDLDPRLGPAIEFLAAGGYHRLAFSSIRRIEFEVPKRVRDLYWIPAKAQMSDALGGAELEQILIPVLYPHSYLFDDDATRLGQLTDWSVTQSGTELPFGRRLLDISGEQISILDIRVLEFDPPATHD